MANLEGTVPLTTGNYGAKDVDVYLWYNESSTQSFSFADGPVYYSDEDRGDITLEVVHVDEALSNLTNIRLSCRVMDNRVIRVWVDADHHFVSWEGGKPVTVRVRFGTPVFGGKLTGELNVASIGGGTMSHIGMIIHSTTLDTMEKVIDVYGGTTWVRLKDVFLLGASGNHAPGSTGGSEDAVLMDHVHIRQPVTGNTNQAEVPGVVMDQPDLEKDTVNYATGTNKVKPVVDAHLNISTPSHTHAVQDAYTAPTPVDSNITAQISNGLVVTNVTGKNMPPYKAVYIWERTA